MQELKDDAHVISEYKVIEPERELKMTQFER